MNAQQLALQACRKSKEFLLPGISEREFSDICERIMKSLGAEDLWYQMLVNFGHNTIYCTRGDHLPSNEVVLNDEDLVLLDFSPKVNGLWGDYSETIVIGHKKEMIQLTEDAKSIFLRTFGHASKCKTIGEIFTYCNDLIVQKGYKLLDPNGNIGHSIENYNNQSQRIYISPENANVLLADRNWAIEPHIGKGIYGAKFEDVIMK
ncbi:aminopeptidase P family protein [Paenibacillus sp. F411]|uniref:M24 family metallopeptidase n=1 Tax=Paenibacillus sp. F411 TaxID=2820239 RepID=UPI001AAFACE8|nr:M24 family metallopeptidase [Paenibacillus sp. F411]MBO2942632.1 aminopeptidase P family protein [Paenibacillus sp. F411]